MDSDNATAFHGNGEWVSASSHQGCCDCGLVHRMEYRVRNRNLECRAFRAQRITVRNRKRFSFPFKKVKA
jgi:hypothetical protein